ncbi:MAG: hypothetical protein ACPHUF_09185 [Gammaproteobacteria bacterium]
MSAPYPWLESAWRQLQQRQHAGTLGHAYILCGPEGLGKFDFSLQFSRWLLCERLPESDRACETCRGCTLSAGGSHPDLNVVSIDDDRKALLIDQIREVGDYYTLKSHQGGAKITIIDSADTMNRHAANALLKVLEEPPPGAVLLLVSSEPGRLPQTILSRCQRLDLKVEDFASARQWLEQACEGEARDLFGTVSVSGAPLAIKAELESADGPIIDHIVGLLADLGSGTAGFIDAANTVSGAGADNVLDHLELSVRTMILSKLDQSVRSVSFTEKSLGTLRKISNKLNSKRLFLYLDHISSARATLRRSSGVRSADVIENVFYEWRRTVRTET